MSEGVRESIIQKLCSVYRIEKLAKFQEEIVNNDEFYFPIYKNLLFSSPTGTGKSLIAETIACVNVILSQKKCIFIQPYIASASELFFTLQKQWRSLGLTVKAHFGPASLSLQEEFNAVVCTIEKGASLINRLVKEHVIDQFCTIVIDEVHMAFDNDRGSVIEDVLLKLRFLRSTYGSTFVCQIIAMSATIEDASPLETLLDTTILDYNAHESRELDEFYSVGSTFYRPCKGSLQVSDKSSLFNFRADNSGILNLVMEALIDWKAVLVFCRTKALVEKNAKLIAMCITQCSKKSKEMFEVLKERVGECNLLSGCRFMDKYVQSGVAFHHSGVPHELRKKIEALYRDKKIAVIVCTSTLSTGVNLPASRVVINLAENFHKSLNYVAYHQMIGRTGRRGFGRGESYLVATDINQLHCAVDSLQKRKFTPQYQDYTHLVLDSISIGLIKSKVDAVQITKFCQNKLLKSIEEIFEFLCKNQLIGVDGDNNVTVAVTQLGAAISSSFLTPIEGLCIYRQLEKAYSSFDLRTDLQMLHLITPLPSRIGLKHLNLSNLFKYHEKLLTGVEKEAAKKIGITNASCLKMSFGHRNDEIHEKFLFTLILREIVEGCAESDILNEFGLDEMQLELLKAQTIVYLKTVISITDQLGWNYLNIIMKAFGHKIEMIINPDITDLMHLAGIDGIRAVAFVDHGIDSVKQLSVIDPLVLEKILRHAVPFKEGEKKGDKNEWLQGRETDCKTAIGMLISNAQQILKSRDENRVLHISMNESARQCETTIHSLLPGGRSCLESIIFHSKFLVLDFVDGRLQILNDQESLLIINFEDTECPTCSETVVNELERLFSSSVPTFARDLSLLFYQCKAQFIRSSYVQQHVNIFLNKFHCISSVMRVRHKMLGPEVEALDIYINTILARFRNNALAETCIYLLCRLIKNVILQQKVSDHIMKLTSIWNESVHTAIYMSYNGIQVDLNQVNWLRESLHKLMSENEEQIYKLTNQRFNIYKVSSTRKVLSECKVFMDNNLKAPGSIEELKNSDHPIAQLIVRARNAYTAYNQVESIVSCCESNGTVRCFYNTLSHLTGRIGIENPPIQMLIKKEIVEGQSARTIFTAKEGYVLISADFSQLELRMILAMSGDKTLARFIEGNVDPFEYLSTSLSDEAIHIDRDTAKKLFYSIVYGIGAVGLADELNIQVKQAEKLLTVFSRVFAGVHCWLKRVTQIALERRYATNIWGLGIGLEEMKSTEAKRRIPNYIIQSSVTYVFRVALNNVRMSMPKTMGSMVLQIHDELICEVRRDCVDECTQLIKKLMRTSILGVDFPISIKIGSSWGQMDKVE